MRKTAATALASLLFLSLPGCGWDNLVRAERTIYQTIDHIHGSALEIKTHNGQVEIVAAPEQGAVAIEAKLWARAPSQEEADARLAGTTLIASRDATGRLTIMPVFPEPSRGRDGASITIRVPNANGVNIDTTNGSVSVTGLSGPLVVDTYNGQIDVDNHEGPAHLDTSNSSVVVDHHVGALEINTSNGSIKLRGINGRITADTSNSSIEVTLAADQTGPFNLDTSNASVHVQVGPGFVGSVSFGTSNGSITVRDTNGRITSQSMGRNSGRIVVGEGGAPSRIGTSNGRIQLTIG